MIKASSSFLSVLLLLCIGGCGDEGPGVMYPEDATADVTTPDADSEDSTVPDADPSDATVDADPADAASPDADVPDAMVDADLPDAMVSDRPTCQFVGTRSEGWYAPDGARICWGMCAGAVAACEATGTRSEGWYADLDGKGCPDSGRARLIQYVPPPGCASL